MKHLKQVILAMLAMLCVVAGVIGLAACGGGEGGGGGPEIGAEYKAVYDFYKQAAGDNAVSLENWYAELTSDIAAVDAGEVSNIGVIELNSKTNVKVTFANGKIYLQPLVGGDEFHEYAQFVLNAKNGEGAAVSQVSLDICAEDNGEYQTVQTVRTNVRGTADAYCEITSAATKYYVCVADASAATYGIAHGYEPELTVASGTHTVEVTVGTPIDYSITVNDNKTTNKASSYADMEVSIRYTETAKQGFVVVSGKTDAEGKLTLTFTPHTGSTYELVVKEGTQPAGYEDVEPAAVDLEGKASVLQLYAAKIYGEDINVEYTAPRGKSPDVPNRSVEVIEIGDELGELVKGGDNFYTYNGEPVYVALGYQLDRVYNGKTIADLIKEEATKDYFSYEERTDEETNTWQKHLFHDMLSAYAEKVDNNGLYPLNEDLYKFISKGAEHHLFAVADETADNLEILLPLVKYGEPWLAVDGPEVDAKAENLLNDTTKDVRGAVIEVPVNGITAGGYYQLTLSNVTLPETAESSVAYSDYIYYGYTVDDYIIKNTEAHPNENYRHYFVLQRVGTENKYQTNIYLPKDCEAVNIVIDWNGITARQNSLAGTTFKVALTTIEGGESWTSVEPVLLKVEDSPEKPTEKEFEVLAFPSSWLTSTQNNYDKWNVNWSTYGSLISTERGYEDYAFTITSEGLGSVTGLKVAFAFFDFADSGNDMYIKGKIGGFISAQSLAAGGSVSVKDNSWGCSTTSYNESARAYVAVFTCSGNVPQKIKVKFQVTSNFYRVHYSAGEGVGEDAIDDGFYSYRTGYTDYYAADPAKFGYSYEGHAFIGWRLVYNGEEEIIQPGQFMSFSSGVAGYYNTNLFLTAQWRETASNVAENMLGLGESGKVTAELDGSKYTETEVKLASGIAEGYYKITADLGTGTLDQFTLTADGVVSEFTPESADGHVYSTYFKVGADTKSIYFPTPTSDFGSATATFKLEKLDENVKLSDNKTATVQVMVNGWQSEPAEGETEFIKVKLDGVTAGNYYVRAERLEGYGLKVCTESATVDFGEEAEGYIQISEDDEYIWFVGNSARFTHNILATVNLHHVYTITFEKGDGGSTVSGTVPTQYCDGGATVTIQSAAYTRENYKFRGWIYDDGKTQTVYRPGDEFVMPEKDIVFTAKWLQNATTSGTLSSKSSVAILTLDPDMYTASTIIISSNNNDFAFIDNKTGKNGVLFFADLGKTDFSGTFVYTTKDGGNDLNFFYSERLSTPDNKVYAAYYVPAQTHYGRTFELKDIGPFEGHPVIAKITYCVATLRNQNDYGALQGYTFPDASNERYAPAGEGGSAFALQPNATAKDYFSNTINSKLLTGGEYTLHVKTNGFKVEGLTDKHENLTFTKGADGYEWTAEVTVTPSTGLSSKNGYLLTYTSLRFDGADEDIKTDSFTPVYIADAWLVAKPEEGVLLTEASPVTVKVKKDAPATVTLGNSMLTGTDYILKATFAGDKKADLSVAVKTTVALDETSGYRNKHVQFSAKTFTVSTESEDELEVTLSVKRFAPVSITDVDEQQDNNRYDLPATDDIDLVPDSSLANNAKSSSFKIWLDLSAVEETAKDNVVVKLTAGITGDKVYTFNKSNNWTVENVTLSGSYYALQSENGAITVNVRIEKLIFIKTTASRGTSVPLSLKRPDRDLWFETSDIICDGNHLYSMRIEFSKSDAVNEDNFTLTYDGDKTAKFEFGSSMSLTYTITTEFVPTNSTLQKFVLHYTGSEEGTVNVYISETSEMFFSYGKNEQTFEIDGTQTKDKYFIHYPSTNKNNHYIQFFAYVPLEEEGIDKTQDFSNLTLKFNDGKSGQPLTVTGFTKQSDGKYMAATLLNSNVSYGQLVIEGAPKVKWTLGYICSNDMKSITSNSKSANPEDGYRFYKDTSTSSSHFSSRYYTLEGFKADTQYKFILSHYQQNPSSESDHAEDELVYTIFQGVKNAPVTLTADEEGKTFSATVEFTSADAVVGISLTGCHSSNSGAYHVPRFFVYEASIENEKEITVDGDAVEFYLPSDIVVPFKIKNFSETTIYTVTITDPTDGDFSTSTNYPILKMGETEVKFKENISVRNIQFTEGAFTLTYSGRSGNVSIKLSTPTVKLNANDGGVDLEWKKVTSSVTAHFDIIYGEDFDFTKTYDVTIKDSAVFTSNTKYTISFITGGKNVNCVLNCVKDGENTFVFRSIKFEKEPILGVEFTNTKVDHNLNISIKEHVEDPKLKVNDETEVSVDAYADSSNKIYVIVDDGVSLDKTYDIVLKLKDVASLVEGDTAQLTVGSFGKVNAVYGDTADMEYVIYGCKFTAETKSILLTTTATKALKWTVTLKEHTDVKLQKDKDLTLNVAKGLSADQKFNVIIDETITSGKRYDLIIKLTTKLVEGDKDVNLTFGQLGTITAKATDAEGTEYKILNFELTTAKLTALITTTATKALTWTVKLIDHVIPKIGTTPTELTIKANLAAADKEIVEIDSSIDLSKTYDIVFVLDKAKSTLATNSTTQLNFGSFGYVKARGNDNIADSTYYIYGVQFTEDTKSIQLTTTSSSKMYYWKVSLREHTPLATLELGKEYTVKVPAYCDSGNNFRIPLSSTDFPDATTKYNIKIELVSQWTGTFYLYFNSGTKTAPFTAYYVTYTSSTAMENTQSNKYFKDYLYIYGYTGSSERYIHKTNIELKITITKAAV